MIIDLVKDAMTTVMQNACRGVIFESRGAAGAVAAEKIECFVEAPEIGFRHRPTELSLSESKQPRQIGVGQSA